MEQYKTCNSCKQTQSLDNFHNDKTTKDGRKSNCKSCTKAKDAERYQRNADRNRARGLAYYYANAEIYAIKSAEKYAANREEISKRRSQNRRDNIWQFKKAERASYLRNAEAKRAYGREYSKKNPDKSRMRNLLRRARLANAVTYQITPKEIKKLYSSPCAFCSSRNEIDLDHIIPLTRDGSHGLGNLMPLCSNCNSTKYNKTIMEWRIYRIRIGNPLPLDKGKIL